MALVAALARAAPADDAASGYGAIRPALVKVWAFDASGRPCASGTGIVVASGAQRSQVLTAEHVVAGAARIRIDVSREQHDIPARVVRTGAHDLALLDVDVGGLQPARFASPSRTVVEGNVVAVAGYVKDDELIGVTGQEPHVLFPATISARPDAGAYLELENVHVEEGLSGGAVFDPQSGDVLGVVTSRTTDARGGFADSSALVVVPFLRPQRVAVAAPAATPAPTTPAPMMPVVVVAPPAVAAWRALQTPPQRFAFVRNGCTTAVVVDVRSLQFAIAHDALVAPQAGAPLLALDVRKRVLPGGACFAVPSTEIAQAAYAPTVMTYDGRHVAMRFAYAGDPADAALFPPAATFDVDLGAQPATATLQLFGQDWAGAIALTLGRAG
jgi:S1-C subfamily serine protease